MEDMEKRRPTVAAAVVAGDRPVPSFALFLSPLSSLSLLCLMPSLQALSLRLPFFCQCAPSKCRHLIIRQTMLLTRTAFAVEQEKHVF